MRILQFGKYYPPHVGGMEKVISTLTEGLNDRGFKCDVLCSNDQPVFSSENSKGYRVTRAKSYGSLASMSLAPGIINLLRKTHKGYDIIHFHHPDPMSALAFFLVRPKAKLIVHWHLDIVKQRVAYLFYRPIENWLLRRADRIIVTSPNYLDASRPLSKHKSKCIVIPLGIHSPPPVDPKQLSNLRSKYPVAHLVFSLGRFTAYKGFEHLIAAAARLPKDHLIVIGGDGPLGEFYKKKIAELKVSDRVHLVGRLSNTEVMEYYAACDAFCLPSITKNEAFGIVLLEAMAYSKPVIATKIPGSGTSWVNQDGITGINVNPGDSNELADAIMYLSNHRREAEAMGKNAKARFENLFQVDRMISHILSIYKKLMDPDSQVTGS